MLCCMCGKETVGVSLSPGAVSAICHACAGVLEDKIVGSIGKKGRKNASEKMAAAAAKKAKKV